MTINSVASRYHSQQASVVSRTSRNVKKLWKDGMSAASYDGSYAEVLPSLIREVSTGQFAAASSTSAMLTAQAQVQGVELSAVVNPAAFAGIDVNGNPIEKVLYSGVITTKQATAKGLAPRDALRLGGSKLLTIATGLVGSSGSMGAEAGIVGSSFKGYVRMLQLPSCDRCTILAGSKYRWNQGFLRHPHCDCVHVPYSEVAGVEDLTTDPVKAFDSLSADEQDRIFGRANATAIREGANISQVVNAKRGMVSSRSAYTSEGVSSRRGFARQQMRGVDRLSPGEIYRQANGDREMMIQLLEDNAYLFRGSASASPIQGQGGVGFGQFGRGGTRAGARGSVLNALASGRRIPGDRATMTAAELRAAGMAERSAGRGTTF